MVIVQQNKGQGSSSEPIQQPSTVPLTKPSVTIEPGPKAPTMAPDTIDVMVGFEIPQGKVQVKGVAILGFYYCFYIAAHWDSGYPRGHTQARGPASPHHQQRV